MFISLVFLAYSDRLYIKVPSKLMITPESPDGLNDGPSLSPRLMVGETGQAFLSVRFIPPRTEQRKFRESYTPVRLRHVL
jgi:hypothetical protein